MKTLIVFSSKYGTTKNCVETLKHDLKGNIDTINIKDNKKIDLHGYDTVIIGSSIYMGSIEKKLKFFLAKHMNCLESKKIGIFLCQCEPNHDRFLNNNFPKTILEKAVVVDSFGGKILLNKLSIIDKIILRLTGKYKEINIIDIQKIGNFAKKINET